MTTDHIQVVFLILRGIVVLFLIGMTYYHAWLLGNAEKRIKELETWRTNKTLLDLEEDGDRDAKYREMIDTMKSLNSSVSSIKNYIARTDRDLATLSDEVHKNGVKPAPKKKTKKK